MANVDPFVIKWPDKWVKDPDLKDVLFYLNRFLHDLWLRTGGGDDAIDDIDNSDIFSSASANQALSEIESLSQIEDLIPTVEHRAFYSTIKDSNYTAVDSDFVEARCHCIITLDANADADAEIIIANGDGTRITVLGDIKYTRTDSKLFINQQGTSLHFQMFVDGTAKYWRIR